MVEPFIRLLYSIRLQSCMLKLFETFHILVQFPFTTNEMELDYYHIRLMNFRKTFDILRIRGKLTAGKPNEILTKGQEMLKKIVKYWFKFKRKKLQ